MKKCFKCNQVKDLTEFYAHPQMPDGRVNKCKECNKKDVSENYKKNREYYIEYDKKRQRHSIDRIFSHRYNGLKARSEVDYSHSNGGHKYRVTGMAYLSRKEFMAWAQVNMDTFMNLYNEWSKSGYNTKLMPSIDRIDNKKGYTSDNMQWLSRSENSRKGTKTILDTANNFNKETN